MQIVGDNEISTPIFRKINKGISLHLSSAQLAKIVVNDKRQMYLTVTQHTTNITLQQGPVVQSVVSLTSSLRVISLTILADSIYNILIFFAEKM